MTDIRQWQVSVIMIYFLSLPIVGMLSLMVIWFANAKRSAYNSDWIDYVIMSACVMLFVSQVVFWVLVWPQRQYVLK